MRTIMVIDDSPLNIHVLKSILAEQYHIEAATSGEEGLELIQRISPSLILVDVILPGIDGFETVAKLKGNSEKRDIPVIFMTGLSDIQSEEKGFTVGGVDYITKPFNYSIVKARVKSHIELFECRRRLENLALFDGLTGIPNRRSFNEKMDSCWMNEHCEGSGAIAMIDIDFFKSYNDYYGHIQGDEALKKTAETVFSFVNSENEFAARFGGEEFIMLLRDKTHGEVLDLCERVCRAVENLKISSEGSMCSPYVTVSIGVVCFRLPEHKNLWKYIDIADKALYNAKTSGRNCVRWIEAI